MKAMRQILSDRLLATVLAVVFAYLLAFQGFAGNMARASMAIAAEDPFHVVCGTSGVSDAATPATPDTPLKKSADCPCATLCRLASPALAAVITPTAFVLAAPAFASADIRFATIPAPTPEPRALLPDARGPPAA